MRRGQSSSGRGYAHHHGGRGGGRGGGGGARGRGRGRGLDGSPFGGATGGRGSDETPPGSGGGGRGGRGGGSDRPPPHLRGRELGLWYAARSKKEGSKKRDEDDVDQMISVMMPDVIVENVEQMLKFVDKPVSKGFTGWPGSRSTDSNGPASHSIDKYTHVKESVFKEKFLDNLMQNARAGEDVPSEKDTGVGESKLDRDPELDEKLRSQMQSRRDSNADYRKMMEHRARLPSFAMRRNILECIEKNQVVVLSGETGCGKTTQVPQFILDDYIDSCRGSTCRILCTQPRRISAISVAERVSQERAEACGTSSGYQIRLQARMPRPRGSILYCTTGILVTKLQSDPLMSEYSHVVLDEIHERDVLSDFLLALVKDILPLRPTLKLVLMSATLNANLFSEYFGKCPMLHIPGLTFPVEEFYLEDVLRLTGYRVSNQDGGRQNRTGPRQRVQAKVEANNYKVNVVPFLRDHLKRGQYPAHVLTSLSSPACEAPETIQEVVLYTIRYICQHEEEGAILVFFPGWEDISKLNRALEADHFFRSGFLILPLHSLMPTVNQRQVFDRPPPGVRKIIIATNIAETSITIDDVVFVIDSGKIKMNTFDTQLNVQSLTSEWVSRANARQRKGRAGRVKPGKCYHVFSRAREKLFADFPLPEMRRMRLEDLCLQIKLLKLGKIELFLSKVIEPPTPRALHLSIELLRELNALDEKEDLTPLGFHLARLPTDPQTGKMLLMAAIFSCVDPITTIAASLSFKDPFYTPLGKDRLVKRIKQDFAGDSRSDHLMIASVFTKWEAACEDGRMADRQFCRENFLSGGTLAMLRDLKKQFAGYLREMEFVASADPKDKQCNVNANKQALVRAVLCAGLYPNVAFARPGRSKAPLLIRTPQDNQKVTLHSKSVLAEEYDFPSPWLVYKLKQKTTNVCLFDASVASPCSLLFFGQEVKAKPVGRMAKDKGLRNQLILSADKHVKFRSSEKVAHVIKRLRASMDDLLDYKITHPGPSNWDPITKEGALLRAIVELLTAEAVVSGLGFAEDDGEDESDYDDYY